MYLQAAVSQAEWGAGPPWSLTCLAHHICFQASVVSETLQRAGGHAKVGIPFTSTMPPNTTMWIYRFVVVTLFSTQVSSIFWSENYHLMFVYTVWQTKVGMRGWWGDQHNAKLNGKARTAVVLCNRVAAEWCFPLVKTMASLMLCNVHGLLKIFKLVFVLPVWFCDFFSVADCMFWGVRTQTGLLYKR